MTGDAVTDAEEEQDPWAAVLAASDAKVRELRGLLGDAERVIRALRAEVEAGKRAAAGQVAEHEARLQEEFKRGLEELGHNLVRVHEVSEAAILKKFHTLIGRITTLPAAHQSPGVSTLDELVALTVDPDGAASRAVNKMFAPLPPHQMARLAKTQRKSRKKGR